MRRRNITWVWLLGAAFMVGCGKQVLPGLLHTSLSVNFVDK